MSNDIRYTVRNHWGTFSLDERSYRDYVEGNLWICRQFASEPDISASTGQQTTVMKGVSEEAVALRDRAEQYGMGSVLKADFPGEKIQIPYKNHMKDISIQEMNLSVRASNGLMRGGASTFGKLRELMETETGLAGVRNLGVKSVKEITAAFLMGTYERLNGTEKAIYWQTLLDMRETKRKPHSGC